MRLLLVNIYIILILSIFSCAKQNIPMGGPKDEDPPELLLMTPANESINVKPSTIELEFNEYVKVENPNKQIIITPRIKKEEMEVTANRNRVIIKLNQELEDSTTYVFNFQKSISDITEENTPENLRLVFSTGPDIDSLRFSGNVAYIFNQRDPKMKDVYIGLYEIADTTDILTGPPYYIGQADSIGNFTITNIKAGEYLAYAWHDSNNSLKAEEKQEAYGFLKDTIYIDQDLPGAQFYLSKADLSEFKINRSNNVGENFDVVLSKFPLDVTIEHEDLNKELFYRRSENNLRFYHTSLRNDSTQVRLQLRDSTGLELDTIFYAKFEESDRRKEKLEMEIRGRKNFVDKLEAEFKFNKPVTNINFDSLLIKYDTASIIPIQKDWVFFKDSTNRTLMTFQWIPPDSIEQESFTLYITDSTFFDVEGLHNENKLETAYKRLKKETLSDEIQIKVNTEQLPILIQIITKQDEIIAEKYLEDTNETTFNYIEPGTYLIRAIVDINKNRRWDTSNMYKGIYAEPIYYVENPESENPRDVTVRGGWTLDLEIQQRNPQGLNTISVTKEEIFTEEDKKDVDNLEN
jgi:uncharacterized protein (DUF2141 family)